MNQENEKETLPEEEKENNSNKEENQGKEENTTKPKKKDKYKEEVEKLKGEIEKLKNDNLKMKDDYLRARADLENTRRRLNEDALQTKKYASMKLVEELVNPVDMLVKVCNMETQNPEINNFLIGFKMIAKQLNDILASDGLKEIEALGKEFDPNIHHAISSEYREGVEPNMVLEVMQTGYKYKDRVLRPAMVKVSIEKPEDNSSETLES